MWGRGLPLPYPCNGKLLPAMRNVYEVIAWRRGLTPKLETISSLYFSYLSLPLFSLSLSLSLLSLSLSLSARQLRSLALRSLSLALLTPFRALQLKENKKKQKQKSNKMSQKSTFVPYMHHMHRKSIL